MSFLWHSLALTAAHWLFLPSSLSGVDELSLPTPAVPVMEVDGFQTNYVNGMEGTTVMENATADGSMERMMNQPRKKVVVPSHRIRTVLEYKGLLFEASMKTESVAAATHFHEQRIIPLEFDMGAEISVMLKDRSEADGITHISSISMWNVTGHGSSAEAAEHGGQVQAGQPNEALPDASQIHDRHQLSPHVPWDKHDAAYQQFESDYLYDKPDQGFFNVKWYLMDHVQSPSCWQPLERLGGDLKDFYNELNTDAEGHHEHAEHAHPMMEAALSHTQIMGMRGLVVTKVMQIFREGTAGLGLSYFSQILLPTFDSLSGLVSAGILYDEDKLMVLYLWESVEARTAGQPEVVPDVNDPWFQQKTPSPPPLPAGEQETVAAPTAPAKKLLLRQIVENYEEAVWFWNHEVEEEHHPDLPDE